MSWKSVLKRLKKALPVIIANAPAVIDAATQVAKAVKKKPEEGTVEPAPAER